MRKKIYTIFFIIPILFFEVQTEESAATQKLRVIKSSGTTKFWVKKDAQWKTLSKKTQLTTGHTIKTLENSELHISIEPAITTMLSENSLLNLNKLLINHEQKAIRMRLNFQKGKFEAKMPSHLGYTLLLTIITPSAHIYISNADFTISVDQHHVTTFEVLRGSAKILHNESENKSILYQGNRAIVKLGQPEIDISLLTEAPEKQQRRKQSPVTVAILSIQSKIVPRGNLEPLSDHIAQQIEKRSNTSVLFLEDVRAMLKAEGIQNLLNCYTDSCISKIGGFLGVDIVIIGKLGQIGNRYIFNLKLIDALRDKTKSRVNAVVDNDIGVIFNEVPALVDTLIAGKITPVVSTDTPAEDSVSHQKILKEMVWIFPGTFGMGSKVKEGEIDELPLHKVTLNGFYLDKYEVTREDFERVMGYNPSKFKGCKNCPVDNVSWLEAQEYCTKAGRRLPTEAEWEHACRSGTKTQFYYGNSIQSEKANFNGQYPYGNVRKGPFRQKPLPVGSYEPNVWNLYDMHGNIAEWCSDWYDVAYYGNSDEKNPKGPKEGQFKVVRGGSWKGNGASLRSANRISYSPSIRLNTIGFRCAKDSY